MALAVSLAERTVARPPARPAQPSLALADALDRILHTGAMVEGNVTIGLADVELLFLDLRLLVAGVDTIWPEGRPPQPPLLPPQPRSPELPDPEQVPRGPSAPFAAGVPAAQAGAGAMPRTPAAPEPAAAPKSLAGGLVKLVLTLVKLLHDVLEKQALRRVENGHLTDAQIENVGAALLAQATEIERLRRHFGFSDADLGIDLHTPIGSN